MKLVWISLAMLLSLHSYAQGCHFSTQSTSGQSAAMQCGMSKTALVDTFGAPLFYNDIAYQSDNAAVENWVFRLKNEANVPKMVSVRIINGSVQNIIVSR